METITKEQAIRFTTQIIKQGINDISASNLLSHLDRFILEDYRIGVPEQKEQIGPIRVGVLKREYGYNGYEPILAGTPIFEQDGKYFFEMRLIKGGHIHKQIFPKDTFAKDVEFIVRDAF